MVNMAQPTRPGNHERGWNDPPVLLHNSTAPTVPAPRRNPLLTKRVAHPDGDTSAAAPPTTDAGVRSQRAAPVGNLVLLPPSLGTSIPRFAAPIIVPSMSPSGGDPCRGSTATNPMTSAPVSDGNDDGIPNCDDDRQLRCFVTSRLQRTLHDCRGLLKPKVVEDVEKKLDVLCGMWDSGQLSYHVKSTMARLVTALHKRKCDLAHELHIGLMMDYVSEVSGWMVGVKRLIQEARGVDAPLSPTDGSTVDPPASTVGDVGVTGDVSVTGDVGVTSDVSVTGDVGVTSDVGDTNGAATDAAQPPSIASSAGDVTGEPPVITRT